MLEPVVQQNQVLNDYVLESRELENRISALILESVHTEVPSHDTDLFETGILDSFGLVELLYQIGEELEVSLPIDEIDFENFRSVAQMAHFVQQRKPHVLNGKH